ncbi:hypothetical protein B0H11DRAFT_2419616 [Mycena galericulata]|nr:hypothetical protein B0H11DRAFT_2419616 [Mycena galericulata]
MSKSGDHVSQGTALGPTSAEYRRKRIAKIWKSIRHKDITRQIKNFLWKTVHDAHRIGKFWTHIPGYEERAECHSCGEVESMEHILLKCRKPGQAKIWELAETLWKKKHPEWPQLSMGAIMGCALANFTDEKGRPLPGANRLYRIIITESIYLIWKTRCDSVIGHAGKPVPEVETHNKWVSLINERLKIDRVLTNEQKFGKQASVDPVLVLQTWSRTLKDEDKMPENWLREPEVLVGVEPQRSRRSTTPPPGRRGRNR